MIKELTMQDCQNCIDYILDSSVEVNTRLAAIESLIYCRGQAPKDVLFNVLMDANEPDYIREEAASSLGTLWAESEIEYERLIQIDPPLLDEVLCDFDRYHLKLNKIKLGDSFNLFIERYGDREFMA